MKLKLKMKMYPPRVKLTVKMGPSLLDFKLPIKFEGCLDEDLDTELIFPLDSPLIHTCKFICWPSPSNQSFYRQIAGYQRGVGDHRVGQ